MKGAATPPFADSTTSTIIRTRKNRTGTSQNFFCTHTNRVSSDITFFISRQGMRATNRDHDRRAIGTLEGSRHVDVIGGRASRRMLAPVTAGAARDASLE